MKTTYAAIIFAEISRSAPGIALYYAHAELAQQPDLFAEIARAEPHAALVYAHAELAQQPDLFAEIARAVRQRMKK